MTASWVAVVPVKPVHRAKTRLDVDVPGGRSALAHAFALDTVRAVSSASAVVLVVVVSDDPVVSAGVRGPGVEVIPEPRPSGLNAAVAAGVAHARGRRRDAGTIVLPGDLPTLRPQDLDVVLAKAAEHPRGVVGDHEAVGTTVLTARPGVDLVPRFGPGSLERHRDDGAVLLDVAGLPRAARDVDTAAHLAQAIGLGVGPETARVLAGADTRPGRDVRRT